MGEFQSIIDPPGEKTSGHSKWRENRSQDEEVETGDFKGGVLEEEMEKNEQKRSH